LCVVTLLGGSFIDLSNLCCCVACVVSAHMRVWLIWFASPCLVSFLHWFVCCVVHACFYFMCCLWPCMAVGSFIQLS
jgi:hypothetical protein